MKECKQCKNKVLNDKNICDKCGYQFSSRGSFVLGAFIAKMLLIGYIVGVFSICFYSVKTYINDNKFNFSNEESCMLNCSPKGYIYNENEDVCTCVSHQEEINNRCKIDCNSENFYVNDDNHCICDGGEKVYSSGMLIYSNDEVYEYEDNFNNWMQDMRSDEVFVTVIANSHCGHCVKYQPIVHNLWEQHKFKLHLLHTDELTKSEYDELFSINFPDYGGTPYTFIMHNGEVIDYLDGVVTKDTLYEFLRRNDIINY